MMVILKKIMIAKIKEVKIINPKKNYINFFRKYKIQDVIKAKTSYS